MRCSGGDAKERYKCVDSRAPQLVRAINMFEDFLDFFFSRSFLIVLLLTALFPTRLARLILPDSPISSSLLLQNQKRRVTQNQSCRTFAAKLRWRKRNSVGRVMLAKSSKQMHSPNLGGGRRRLIQGCGVRAGDRSWRWLPESDNKRLAFRPNI